jgi:hypothetical protein
VWDGGPGNIYGFGMQSLLLQIYSQSASSRVGIGWGSSASFTEVLTVNGNGCVGIGITTPTDGLVINGLSGAGGGQLRMISGNYGVFFRNDGNQFYCMVTASGSPTGTWTGPYPWQIDLASHSMTVNGALILNNWLSMSGLLTVGGGITSSGGNGINTTGISFVQSNDVNSDFNHAAIQVRESQQAGPPSSGDNRYAPRIAFHWGGVVASQIGMDNSGTIRTIDNPGTGYAPFACSTLVTHGAITSAGGDITVYRPDLASGAIFFGNTGGVYMYWDGSNMQINRPLTIGGSCNVTGQYLINGTPISTGIPGMYTQNNGSAAIGPFQYFNFQPSAQFTWSNTPGGPGNNTLNILGVVGTSDIRLKQNVAPLTGGLSVIEQLRPVRAEWNGLGYRTAGQPVISVIAQDLQQVIPDAVSTYRNRLRPDDSDDVELLAIDSMALVSYLILSVQELSRRLKALEPTVN